MKYQGNPVIVEAHVITSISSHDELELTLSLDNGEQVIATQEMIARMTPVIGDYWVVQSDGYTYLNPKLVFERKYSPLKGKGLTFSEALELIKRGKKLARSGWNGSNMFLYLVHGSEFEINRAPLNAVFEMGARIKYRPHIDLKAADGTCGVWSPNNSDVLGEDWYIVE